MYMRLCKCNTINLHDAISGTNEEVVCNLLEM